VNKAGELDGLSEWYFEDGQLEVSENYIADVLDGPYERYYENGQLRVRGNYKAGKLISYECWSEQGLTADCF
jgi:antitoxin component YwqK of YwqJK toxin-antitoxin module